MHPDDLLGAGVLAHAAAGALGGVYLGQAVGHMDGVKLADGLTVAEAQAAVGAGVGAGKQGVGRPAAGNALVLVLALAEGR